MGTLNEMYAAGKVNSLADRRWVLDATYRLYDLVVLRGYPLATARTMVLNVPQYQQALNRNGLLTTFNSTIT